MGQCLMKFRRTKQNSVTFLGHPVGLHCMCFFGLLTALLNGATKRIIFFGVIFVYISRLQ